MYPRWLHAPLLALLALGPCPLASAQTPQHQPAIVESTAPGPATPVPEAQPPSADRVPVANAPTAEASSQAAASAPSMAATLPHDLSPWSMFLNADIVVKAVMVGLMLASVATWTLWLGKSLHLLTARRRAAAGLRALATASHLPALAEDDAKGVLRIGPVAALVRAAEDEAERSTDLPADGVKERVALALGRIEARAVRRMTQGTGIVATIGSTAPFVGLFGTVWGIMNSFVGISQAHTSNLAVVAPGIAEALLATAVGLVAAIPAVVIFNGFARATAGYRALLGDASAEVMRHLSRDLDRRSMPLRRAAE